MGLGKRLSLARGSKKADGKGAVDAKVTEDSAKGAEETAVAEVPDVVQAAALAAADGDAEPQSVAQDVVPAEATADEPAWQLAGPWLQRAREELHEDPETTPGLLDRLRQLVLGEH